MKHSILSILFFFSALAVIASAFPHFVFADASGTTIDATSTATTTIIVSDTNDDSTSTDITPTTTILEVASTTETIVTTTTIDTIATTTSVTVMTASTTIATTTVAPAPQTNPPLLVQMPAQIEPMVKSYFSDIPVMADIAQCESSFRQFNANGSVFYGGTAGAMVGIFQLDERVHAATAASLGWNIDTVNGNMGYARYLYEKQGTSPWISSFPCWNLLANPTSVASPASTGSAGAQLTLNLSFGMINSQVVTLQKMLNQDGFPVAQSGPGSPGNETTLFGVLTRAAVRKFQCTKNIACSGDEYTTGYGFVNGQTRTALAEAATPPNLMPAVAASTSSQPITQSGATSANASDQTAILEIEIAGLKAQVAALEQQLATLLSSKANN